jgi:hypothetical protein
MTINDLQHLSQLDGGADGLSQTIGGYWDPKWNIDPKDLHNRSDLRLTAVTQPHTFLVFTKQTHLSKEDLDKLGITMGTHALT